MYRQLKYQSFWEEFECNVEFKFGKVTKLLWKITCHIQIDWNAATPFY